MHGAGLMQFVGDKVEPYPVRGAINPNRLLPDRDVDSNRLLRDRDGGLWIGTVERGLIHIHHGRTDVFTQSDGLSGDVISVFSRTVKAMSGSPPLEDSTGFESSPSLLFL